MKRSTFQAIIFSILTVIVAAVIVVVFIMDHQLKALGYSTEQIARFKQYGIQEKVTSYNPSLLKALESDQFRKENLDYYILFQSDEDMTRNINDLADMYEYSDYERLYKLLGNEDMLQLVFKEKISDVDTFMKIKEHGYDLDLAYRATAEVPEAYLQHFLVSPVYSASFLDSYIQLANTGYSYSFIDFLNEHYTDNISAVIARFKLFEPLEELIREEDFKIENTARYLWYMEKHTNYDNKKIVTDVNKDKDIPSSINYSSLYNRTQVITSPDPLTVLVDKQHRLADDYQPPELVNIDAEYRGNNTPVNREALYFFKDMSDAYLADHSARLICQDGYISFASQQNLYETTIAELSEVDDDDTIVDTFLARAGYSEHQTGLALNITEKGTSIYNLEGTPIAEWLEENAANYGFILRYPKGRDFITGYTYIPYHYRFVGEENAQVMKMFGWTYEEFYYLILAQ